LRSNQTQPIEQENNMPVATKKKKIDVPTLRIGPGRLSWPQLLEPKSVDGGPEKYSTVLLLPPDYDVSPILRALNDLCEEAWGPKRENWPSTARRPEQVVRRAEEKKNVSGYEPGWHFISCNSTEPPGVVQWDKTPVTNPREVYAGRWANVSMRPFIYDNIGVGVSLGLNNVQLLQHGSVFGRTSAEQDFDVEAAAVDQEF
jgi:hypothetical protein